MMLRSLASKESWKLAWHITRRNWVVYRKDLLANTSPTLMDPIFFLLSFGLGLGSYMDQVQGVAYIRYLAPGLVVSTALLTSFFESSYGFYVRMTYESVFQAMLTTPIGENEVVLGEFIWVGLKGAAMALGCALVLTVFGLMPYPQYLPCVAMVGALVGLGCGSLGLLSTAWVKNINQFQTVYSFLISPLFFFSGIFFPIEKMPSYIQAVAYCFPLAHGVKLVQTFFWNSGFNSEFWYHLAFLTAESLLLGYLAIISIRRKLIF